MSVKQKPKPKPSTLATNPRSKPTPIQKPKTISKTKKKDGAKEGGALDEKGNPFPIKNPDGGDPTCPGGYKIDYDFDPFNDPINPLFRCISALKDPNNGPTSNIMNKLNNPESNLTNLVVMAPSASGGRTKRKRQGCMRRRKITNRRIKQRKSRKIHSKRGKNNQK
jgi:hypothetical protein